MAFQLQGVVNEEFKMMGLSLRGDAMAAVIAFLDRSEDANAALSQMLDALDTMTLVSSIVGKDTVEEVVVSLDRANGAGIYGGAAGGVDGDGARAKLDDEVGAGHRLTSVDPSKWQFQTRPAPTPHTQQRFNTHRPTEEANSIMFQRTIFVGYTSHEKF